MAVGALPGTVLIILRPVWVRLLLRRGGTAELGAALALGAGGVPAQRQRQELRQLMPAEEQAGQLRHDRQEGDQDETDAEEGTAIQRPEPDGFEDVLYKIIKNAADVYEGQRILTGMKKNSRPRASGISAATERNIDRFR